MQDKPVVSNGDQFARNIAHELLLYTIRSSATRRDQAYAVAHTKHMGIDSKSSLAPHNGLDYIGSLAPYSWQAYQFF